jgi:phytoene synthase
MDPPEIAHPERRLAIAYAPPAARAGLAVLFALDERLAAIVASTTEPAIGLMRLVWWRDALAALGEGAPPAEPLLVACAGLAASGVMGADLAAMSAGWEALLDDPALDDETVAIHAAERGRRLFVLAGRLLGNDSKRLGKAGEGWVRVDLAFHASNPLRAAAILASARAPLEDACGSRWPRAIRPLGQLAVLALGDVRGKSGPGRRLLRILRVQTIGR